MFTGVIKDQQIKYRIIAEIDLCKYIKLDK